MRSRQQLETRVKAMIMEITGHESVTIDANTRLVPYGQPEHFLAEGNSSIDNNQAIDTDYSPPTSLERTLNITSLELAELFTGIEQELQVEISDEVAQSFTTIDSVIDYLWAKLKPSD